MGRTILVVDDEPNIVLRIQRDLEREGYAVLTARHGGEALQVLREQPVDLLITDTMMPEMDGVALIKSVRQNPDWANVRIILIGFWPNTYSREEEHKRVTATPGVDFFLVKPLASGEVETFVKRALEAYEG